MIEKAESETDVLRALGRLSFEFSRLETLLGCTVGYLTNPTDVNIGQILVSEMSFRARVAALSALYPARVKKQFDKDALASFLSSAHSAENERNKLIHSFYRLKEVGSASAIRIKVTAKERGGMKIQSETVGAASIAERANNICRAAGQLRFLMATRYGFADFTRYVSDFYRTFTR